MPLAQGRNFPVSFRTRLHIIRPHLTASKQPAQDFFLHVLQVGARRRLFASRDHLIEVLLRCFRQLCDSTASRSSSALSLRQVGQPSPSNQHLRKVHRSVSANQKPRRLSTESESAFVG